MAPPGRRAIAGDRPAPGIGLVVDLGEEGHDGHAQSRRQTTDQLGRGLAATALDVGQVRLAHPGPPGQRRDRETRPLTDDPQGMTIQLHDQELSKAR